MSGCEVLEHIDWQLPSQGGWHQIKSGVVHCLPRHPFPAALIVFFPSFPPFPSDTAFGDLLYVYARSKLFVKGQGLLAFNVFISNSNWAKGVVIYIYIILTLITVIHLHSHCNLEVCVAPVSTNYCTMVCAESIQKILSQFTNICSMYMAQKSNTKVHNSSAHPVKGHNLYYSWWPMHSISQNW